MPPALFAISGLIPLTQTLFCGRAWSDGGDRWYLDADGVFFGALGGKRAHGGELRLSFIASDAVTEQRTRPGEWLEYSPLLTILVGACCSGIL